jgi:hypothetical protein
MQSSYSIVQNIKPVEYRKIKFCPRGAEIQHVGLVAAGTVATFATAASILDALDSGTGEAGNQALEAPLPAAGTDHIFPRFTHFTQLLAALTAFLALEFIDWHGMSPLVSL